ncbi:hypothetical protein [Gilvibacter sp.]|uniref:hypothetical protein n=1 Tax=Gilvibacter sp. TaxID=2729997 RepID=UPI0035BE819B
MKLKWICYFLFLALGNAIGQQAQQNLVYANLGLNLGNYVGFDAELNYIRSGKYSFKLGYSGNIREPVSEPADYSSGLTGALLLGLANPFDQMEQIYAGAGRVWVLNPSGTIRLNAGIGLGFTIIREPGNWQRVQDNFLVENYTWEYNRYNTFSLIFNPKIEFPITRFYGLFAAPFVQLNKDRTFFGISIGHMIGVLRSKEQSEE